MQFQNFDFLGIYYLSWKSEKYPLLYIPEENLGIRLEDDVVVQEKGEPFNLMKNIPLEADEIEDLMN